jgi:hypothetical protein
MEHPFSVSKGITIMPPVIGRITAGHTVVRGDKAFPVRDDHFTVTTLMQDKETRAWEPHPLHATLAKGGEKLRAIPVRIAYDDVGLCLHNRFTAFDLKTGRALCVGNGERARRAAEDGIKDVGCPGPDGCDYAQRQRCKSLTRAYFRIEGQQDELGVFILRSGSYNTLGRLFSRLSQLAGLTGGRMANMPMMLVLEAKTTAKSFREPVFFADLVTRPGMPLKEAIMEARAFHEEMDEQGLSTKGMEEALRAGLGNSAFADEIEDADEWMPDEDLIAAAETQGKGLRGMDSLAAKLDAMAGGSSPSRQSAASAETA